MHDIYTIRITTRTCASGPVDSDRPFTSEGRFQSQSRRVGCVMGKVALGRIHLRKLRFTVSELFTDTSCSFAYLPSTINNLSTWGRHSINCFSLFQNGQNLGEAIELDLAFIFRFANIWRFNLFRFYFHIQWGFTAVLHCKNYVPFTYRHFAFPCRQKIYPLWTYIPFHKHFLCDRVTFVPPSVDISNSFRLWSIVVHFK